MENRKKSYLFVSIAVLLWASTAAIAKLLLQNLSGIQIMFYSFIFAILGLFSIVIAQGKLKSLKSYTKKIISTLPIWAHSAVFIFYFFTRSFKVCTRSRSLHFELFMADNGSYFRHTNSERKTWG